MVERGVTEAEIAAVLQQQESEPALFERRSKRRAFRFFGEWKGRQYPEKMVEVIYKVEAEDTIVVTVKSYYGKWE